ncbi:hypothetical protein A6A03_14765 [Chloroflexus islandicus]|uniref:Minimal CRISPR polymerase domain-containing protein n=1 Tax=Chloroflexus islandicus TaxID=1707952 RepID=A0A178MBP3_9CHLR|nr:mCpol domain-containing protein [Chloroflexus islandicus]OAN45438.1 hypothetical protein A6A03_14765 [Chloroflexus islandicus]
MIYVSVDGDDIGRLLTQKIYQANNDDEVRAFSELVTTTFQAVAAWVIQNQGEVLFCTGDSIFFKISEHLVDNALRHFELDHFTISVGIGETRKEAHWALNIAKSLGKARIVNFNEVRRDIFGKVD